MAAAGDEDRVLPSVAVVLAFIAGSLILIAPRVERTTVVVLEDSGVSLSVAVRDGIRYAPAYVTEWSTRCRPFAMQPNATVRNRLNSPALSVAEARRIALPTPPRAPTTSCHLHRCDANGEKHILSLSDVCFVPRNNTLVFLSNATGPDAGQAPPVLYDDTFWGPSKSKRYAKRFISERAPATLDEHAVWVESTWMLSTPRFRFGQRNLFHAILEELGWLARAMECAQAAADADHRFLLMHGRRLFGENTAGRVWELAVDGLPTYYVPGEVGPETAFCFRRAHVESQVPLKEVGALEQACDRARAAAGAGPSWPGWPAGKHTFHGVENMVASAHRRLGLPKRPATVEGRWARPRVTIVHRLGNRRLANLQYLAMALRDHDMDATVVALECMPLEAQVVLVANSSTLLGVHGAGLTLGHVLPWDALVIELRSGPCTEEARGVPYQMRKRNKILPAVKAAVLPHKGCPQPWKYNSRAHDVVIDVAAVLATIHQLDPIASRRRRGRGGTSP